MTDSARIAELRRRVERDPASIAFAQLAEEYRREGNYEQAVEVCRAGLAQYPEYLSARVTLGRALTELGRFDDARAELERVLRIAPDNLAAKRALADLGQRPGDQLSHPPAGPPASAGGETAAAQTGGPTAENRALTELEALLQAILTDRAERSSEAAGPARRRDATP